MSRVIRAALVRRLLLERDSERAGALRVERKAGVSTAPVRLSTAAESCFDRVEFEPEFTSVPSFFGSNEQAASAVLVVKTGPALGAHGAGVF